MYRYLISKLNLLYRRREPHVWNTWYRGMFIVARRAAEEEECSWCSNFGMANYGRPRRP